MENKSLRICFCFASRSRPQQFFAVLDNIREMSASDNYFVWAKLDEDDGSMMAAVAYQKLAEYPELQVKWGRSKNKTHAINRDLDNLPPFDIMICMSDDQLFTVKGFDDIIRKNMPADLDGFLHFPDNYKKASVCTMSIMGANYFKRFNYIYHPAYYSLWCDNEATEVAKLLDKYIYIPEQIFEHNHYSTGRPKDQLYKRNDTYRRDRVIYKQRKEKNFDLPFPKTPFLLIKYATRGRWRMFFDAIDNIHATIRTNQFKVIVSADTDDVEMANNEVREFIKRYPNVEIYYDEPVSKIAAINRNMPTDGWDWRIVMSDDMKFLVPGWDMKMLADIRTVWPEGWDWYAHFPDGFVNEKLPTMDICGRAYHDRFGYCYQPDYKSVSCDAENLFVAMMLGKYHYFPTLYFKHLHPANLKQPSDVTLRRNHAYGVNDTATYFTRLKMMFGIKDPVMVPEQMKPYL